MYTQKLEFSKSFYLVIPMRDTTFVNLSEKG